MNFIDKDGTTKVYILVHPWDEFNYFAPMFSMFSATANNFMRREMGIIVGFIQISTGKGFPG